MGIHASCPLSLFQVSKLTAALERALGRGIGLLIPNIALKHNPALAHKAIPKGDLVSCRHPEAFVDFKTKAILRYLDTAFLRATVTRAFQERLTAGRFGERG